MHRSATNLTASPSTIVWLIFFLSGAAGLIYEISWSRQIGLLFGHTAQAASIVLSSYFSGMAIGYWLGARGKRIGQSKNRVMKSAFEGDRPYELTKLGQQFVHYTMNELVPKIGDSDADEPLANKPR